MDLTTRRMGRALVLRPELARLDASVAITFKEKVGKVIAEGEKRLILDLGRIEFVDSSGLGALVALLKRLGNEGTLALAGLRPPVQRLLALTRLDRVFRVADTVENAELALAGDRPT